MICKVELRAELEKSLAAGVMTDRFAVLAQEIVSGYFRQSSLRGFPDVAREEFMDEFRMRLVRHWHKLDPRRNPFAAITQQGRWAGMTVVRKYNAHKKRFERMVDSGALDEALGETAL